MILLQVLLKAMGLSFFLDSRKGQPFTDRDRVLRKRGETFKTKGISNDHVAVIITQDRKSTLDLKSVAAMGRLKKQMLRMP